MLGLYLDFVQTFQPASDVGGRARKESLEGDLMKAAAFENENRVRSASCRRECGRGSRGNLVELEG